MQALLHSTKGLPPQSTAYTCQPLSSARRATGSYQGVSVPQNTAPAVRCAFSTEIYTRGCHWFPRMLA
jgi:hypothetical protein